MTAESPTRDVKFARRQASEGDPLFPSKRCKSSTRERDSECLTDARDASEIPSKIAFRSPRLSLSLSLSSLLD